MFKYLGIDWGKTNIGLAIADSENKMALAYDTLKNDKNFIKKLTFLIQKEKIKIIVLGKPLYNNENKTALAVEKLAKKLQSLFSFLRIYFQNEMFTTQSAQANLIEKNIKNIKRFDNQEAARIILQDWLDKH